MGKFTNRMTKSWTEFERAGSGDPFGESKTFINNLYQVSVDEDIGGALHLSIVRRDRRPIRDWRHLQRIKNEIAGPDREAVEIYPAESRLVDTNNQYHLWVKRPGERFDFGYADGRASSEDEHTRAFFDRHWKENYGHLPEMALPKQRPFEPHHRSAGLAKVGPVWEAFDGA